MATADDALKCLRCICDRALPVDRFGFERLNRRIAAEVGVTIEVRYADDAGSVEREIEKAQAEADAIVLCPGTLGEVAAVQRATAGHSGVPLVWLDLTVAASARPAHLDPMVLPSVRGRGLEGLFWAVRSAAARATHQPSARRYGPDVEQIGELRLPDLADGCRAPVCVLLHGGGWRERWERDLMDGLAVDLTSRGYATWNLEFRRVGPSGGGWPGTFADVAAGIDHLREIAESEPIDLERVALVGHSAGAHLALWALARHRLPESAPGASPAVRPGLAVSLAGVQDLATCAIRGTDEMSTIALMDGMPDDHPERYRLASPLELLPLGGQQLVVWGTNDRPDLVDENRRYCGQATAAGDPVHALELPGADHFTVIDPASLTWLAIREQLALLFPTHGSTDQEGARSSVQATHLAAASFNG